MFSTPFTCCSIGLVTVSSTTWAFAPGYDVEILTVGGVMSGMLATGRSGIASPPSSTMTIEITIARMGRLMNIELNAPTGQFSSAGVAACCAAATSASVCGVTGKPGRARSIPLTM